MISWGRRWREAKRKKKLEYIGIKKIHNLQVIVSSSYDVATPQYTSPSMWQYETGT